MFVQHAMGLVAGSGMVMGLLGYTYGVGLGRDMSIVVGALSGVVIGLAYVFRKRGIS